MRSKRKTNIGKRCKHQYQVRVSYEEAENFKGDMYQLEVTEVYECLDCKKKITV